MVLQTFFLILTVKENFENRLIFDKVKTFNTNCAIFWPTLYIENYLDYSDVVPRDTASPRGSLEAQFSLPRPRSRSRPPPASVLASVST